MSFGSITRSERVALVVVAASVLLLGVALGLRSYLEDRQQAVIKEAQEQSSTVAVLGETLVLDSEEDEKGIAEDALFQAKFGFQGTMEITLTEVEVISAEDPLAQNWIDRDYDGYLVASVKLRNEDAIEGSGLYEKESRFNFSGICGINSSEVGIFPDLAFFSGTPDGVSDKERYAFDLPQGSETELTLALGFVKEDLVPNAEVYFDLCMDGGARHKYRIDTGLSTNDLIEGLSS